MMMMMKASQEGPNHVLKFVTMALANIFWPKGHGRTPS